MIPIRSATILMGILLLKWRKDGIYLLSKGCENIIITLIYSYSYKQIVWEITYMPHISEYEVETKFIDRLESIGYEYVELRN